MSQYSTPVQNILKHVWFFPLGVGLKLDTQMFKHVQYGMAHYNVYV